MAPRAPKVPTNEDRMKTGCILDQESYLRQHGHSETTKRIVTTFRKAKLLHFVTFNYPRVHKAEVVEFYLNATVSDEGFIKYRVGEVDVTISVEDIRGTFNLLEASNLNPSSISFNQEDFWKKIRKDTAPEFVKFFGKKKNLLKVEWERAIDILYRCIECKVPKVDDITSDKVTVLHAI